MRRRDFHKKQAVKHNSKLQWESYKAERNKVNIQMRQAKSKYFCDKIQNCSHSKDVKKSWSLINTLLGRKQKLSYVKQLIIDDTIISTIISDDKLITTIISDDKLITTIISDDKLITTIISDDKLIAESFNDYLMSMLQ